MDKRRCVLWVFMAALVILLGMPWWLSPQAWAAMLGPGLTWPKGAVLSALAGMATAYFYWLGQLFFWACALSSNERRESHHEWRETDYRGANASRNVSSDACHSVQKDRP